jgi:hypothetical protein
VGEPGRDWYGDPVGKGDWDIGDRVNRYNLGSSCQNALRLTNIFVHPSADDSSCDMPTLDSSDAISPMRSNLGSTTLPLNTPSLFMLMRHSPSGLPASGVSLDSSFVTWRGGSGWWKYQYSVAHNIIASCRVGELAGLKSLLLGSDIDEM